MRACGKALTATLVVALWMAGTLRPMSADNGLPADAVWFQPILHPTSISYNSAFGLVAVPTRGGAVCLYRASDGYLINLIQAHTNRVNVVAFSPDGTRLATGSDDRTIKIWQITQNGLSAVLERTLTGHTAAVTKLSFDTAGTRLASGSDDETVRVWRLSDGTSVRILNPGQGAISAVALSPNGEQVVTGGRWYWCFFCEALRPVNRRDCLAG